MNLKCCSRPAPAGSLDLVAERARRNPQRQRRAQPLNARHRLGIEHVVGPSDLLHQHGLSRHEPGDMRLGPAQSRPLLASARRYVVEPELLLVVLVAPEREPCSPSTA